MKEIIYKLFKQYNLGELIGNVTPVSGGLMHRMFKVQTRKETYAVKCLNSEIMKRPDALDNYARAEGLEIILEKNGIPIVPALILNGRKMIKFEEQFFYIFKWQDGKITDANNISKEQCFKAGEILGRIHAINPQNVKIEDQKLYTIDFNSYLETALKKGSPISTILKDNLNLLKYAQNKLNESKKMLPPMKAISNDDMDPKNIMWNDGKAFVIDLECLGYSNQIESCLNLSLQWAGTVNENFNKDNLAAFYNGYLSSYDNGFRSYNKLFGIAYSWIEWLEYNIKRSLGMEGTAEDVIKVGQTEVINTIRRIKHLHSIENEICNVLDSLSTSFNN